MELKYMLWCWFLVYSMFKFDIISINIVVWSGKLENGDVYDD